MILIHIKDNLNMDKSFLKKLGLKLRNQGTSTGDDVFRTGTYIESYSPVTGELIGAVSTTSYDTYHEVVERSQRAFEKWRLVPAPRRGEIIRQFGMALRENKDALGKLVSFEMGKSLQEGLGEVQEMIDICDFAVGLSRQLCGSTFHSERPAHRMYEQWHPLGVVGIISAFNFPVAVWSWNAMIALVCGNVCVWKPSEKTALSALACHNLLTKVLKDNGLYEGISCLVCGDLRVGEFLAKDPKIALVSATGSTRMGKSVSSTVGFRLGRVLLELGGNNAMIVTPSADLKIVIPAIVFGAVGTAGQRCTSTRRLIVHESQYETVKTALVKAYAQLKVGNPLDSRYHLGPLIDKDAVRLYLRTLEKVVDQGGNFLVEGGVLTGDGFESGCYVRPCIAEVEPNLSIIQHETFAPILYLLKYNDLEEAIAIQNNVPQGLSSAIMTDSVREAELFLSVEGSDCGIANVNIGTSGAEIGGAFGGEKETGGGRESGSDAWKAYMRRQTNTINYGHQLPLAQGIKFDF
jgi:aldehyde dehydrogenase (NAD+)